MAKDDSTTLDNIKTYFKKRCLIKPPVETDPRLFSPGKKTSIVACISLVACNAGFSSTIYFPGNKKRHHFTVNNCLTLKTLKGFHMLPRN